MSKRRTLDLVRGSVLIRFPYADDEGESIRSLCRRHGARWSPEQKAWVIPESKSDALVTALRRLEFEVV
jgi:hypothetical protein